jgi:hypothetical protein
MTGNDVISASLRIIGVLSTGEVASGAESADALATLNRMLDLWNTERLAVFNIAQQTFSLTVDQQDYTIGTGGNFNVARPSRIERVSIIQLSNPALPLEIPIPILSEQQWQRVPVKGITSSLPRLVYIDNGFPLRTLSYWSTPNAAANTKLYTWTSLTAFTLTADNTFPPGYEMAIVYNLAIYLAPEFRAKVSQEVAMIALDAKAKVKSHNFTVPVLTLDSALQCYSGGGGNYNYLDDSTSGW